MGDDEYVYEEYDWGDYEYYDTPKERVFSYVDYLIWSVPAFAGLGFISSITTLVFVALFPKPLKTTIIHCIVLCVSSILTCMISAVQASTWEILADLRSRREEEDFIIVDYAVSWITILLLGVGNWLFVAFLTIRLYAIYIVNINSYNNYVTASANEVDRRERQKPSYVCGVVTLILFFGWLLPTLILPLCGMIEYYYNWLEEGSEVIDVLAFAFKHDFNHRWGSAIYVLLPIGFIVLISAVIVFQTVVKFRGLKFMRGKWDKAKFTLGIILVFLISRIPMLVYVFFSFQAFPAAPKLTGDRSLDRKLADEHSSFIFIGNASIKKDFMAPTGPICLIFACLAAILNFPLFYLSFRRFRSLCSEARTNCGKCGHCCDELSQRSTNDSEVSSTDAETREADGSYIAASITPETNSFFLTPPPSQNGNNNQPYPPYQSSPKEPQAGNFFFNSAHLNGHDRCLAQSSYYHSKPAKGNFV